jgi:hypothetical protein
MLARTERGVYRSGERLCDGVAADAGCCRHRRAADADRDASDVEHASVLPDQGVAAARLLPITASAPTGTWRVRATDPEQLASAKASHGRGLCARPAGI